LYDEATDKSKENIANHLPDMPINAEARVRTIRGKGSFMTQDPYRNTSPPAPPRSASDHLQFNRAESATPPSGASLAGFGPAPVGGTSACIACTRPITDYYFEAAGKVVCPQCQQIISGSEIDGPSAARFFKAAMFGIAAAVAGAAAWYGVTWLSSGKIWGIAALVVAFLIGGAVKTGSGNRGGIVYQLLAVLLTYLAIGATLTAEAITRLHEFSTTQPISQPRVALVAIFGTVIEPVSWAIGNPIFGFIFAFSMWEAWRLNRRQRVRFSGPFRIAPTMPAGGA
jgi:hypothetical protein